MVESVSLEILKTLTGVKSHLSTSRMESLQLNKGCAGATNVLEHKRSSA